MVKKGLFVCFEGLDGSGKGTILSKISNHIFNNFKEIDSIFITREPTYSEYGKQIRQLLRKDKDPLTHSKQLLQLYIDDRKEHLNKFIRPLLSKKTLILCDRYKYSTIVYQQAQGIPAEKIISLHSKMLVPDIVFILDVDVKTAMKRIRGDRGLIEKFEKDYFLDELRQYYIDLPKQLPEENIKTIDATKEPEEVLEQILKELEPLLRDLAK